MLSLLAHKQMVCSYCKQPQDLAFNCQVHPVLLLPYECSKQPQVAQHIRTYEADSSSDEGDLWIAEEICLVKCRALPEEHP